MILQNYPFKFSGSITYTVQMLSIDICPVNKVKLGDTEDEIRGLSVTNAFV